MNNKISFDNYKTVMFDIGFPVLITDFDGNVIYVNKLFEETSGYTLNDIYGKKIGKKSNILYSGSHDDSTYEDLWNTIKSGKSYVGRFKNKKKNGDVYWQDVHISPKNNIINNYSDTLFVASISDATVARYYDLKMSAILESVSKEQDIIILDENRKVIELLGVARNNNNDDYNIDYSNVKISDCKLYVNDVIDSILSLLDKVDNNDSKKYIDYCCYGDDGIYLQISCKRFNSNKYIIIIKDITETQNYLKIQMGIEALETQVNRLIASRN